MAVDATAIIGLLVGFLVVGIIGTYVGDQMISATNLSASNPSVSTVYENVSTPVGIYSWVAPAGVTTISFHAVGGGGGGGADSSELGGGAGVAGTVNTQTGIAVTPGMSYPVKTGAGGAGGAAGTNTSILIGTTLYNAAGGAAGVAGANATPNGSAGLAGYVGTLTGAAAITGGAATGNVTNNTVGGAAAYGYGSSGAGAGFGGVAGTGVRGAIQISYTSYTDPAYAGPTSPLTDSQTSIVETFTLGVLLCKIIVIVSIASIVFVLLQKTGLIPRFGQE